jgi:ABC-type sugar transport system permease subunit
MTTFDAGTRNTRGPDSDPPVSLRRFLRGPWPFLLPGLLIYAFFSVYPIVYQFYVALTDMTLATIFRPNFIGFDNFITVARDPIFRQAFGFTLIFTLVTVPAQFILGFLLALLLDQKLRGRTFFRISIVMPIAISTIVVSLMWRLLLHESNVGLVNAVLDEIGLQPVRWFSDPNNARLSIFLVNLWQAVGGTMIFMLAGLQTIPEEVIEAAKTDGANAWQQITRVKLPLLKQPAGLALIFIFLGTFQIFEKVLALTNGGPGGATATLGFRMYQTAFSIGSEGYLGRGSAMGVVMFVFVAAFALVYLRLIILDSKDD